MAVRISRSSPERFWPDSHRTRLLDSVVRGHSGIITAAINVSLFCLCTYTCFYLQAQSNRWLSTVNRTLSLYLTSLAECWPNMETCVNYQLLIGSSSVRTPPEWVWASALLSSFAASRATQLKPSCGFSDFSCRGNGRDWQAFPPITIEHLPVGGMRLSLNNIWPIRDDQLIN